MKRIDIPSLYGKPNVIHEDDTWCFVGHNFIYVCKDSKPIGEVTPGTEIRVGGAQYVVLGHGKDTTALLYSVARSEFYRNDHVDNDNAVLDILTWAEDIGTSIPKDMLVPHTVKLQAANGDRPKLNVKRNISLLTLDLYRRYRPYLANRELGEFWLATPTSYTHKTNELCFVREDGRIGWCPYPHSYIIRPFLIVDSAYTGYDI